MDHSVIYTKTARGVIDLKNGGKNLHAVLLATLKRVDGSSSFGMLSAGTGRQEQAELEAALLSLEEKQLIRVFSRMEPPQKTTSNEELSNETNSLPVLQIVELGPEESVRAWAEARRGSQELAQSKFYATPNLASNGKSSQERSVLIVEDDPAISMLMKFYLARKGFTVAIVTDGQEALRMLDNKPTPPLVLLDVNLPNVNGFDILTYIRSNESLNNIRAIMVTAQVRDADVLRGLKGGADGYIFKPLEWTAFYECIKRVMRLDDSMDNVTVN